ncbi:hypothetical protein GWI33_018223 [Rhynchophorus ferrugineus]|uniref:Uncharacterized protein n=1 Tax=Rhynchophorus ferrugineus TaxID=354439 RepID=A0A834HWK4_RHYFE|nr:hypothetical protein GWI33_018223 [Rhynchophorus ferrugineus]
MGLLTACRTIPSRYTEPSFPETHDVPPPPLRPLSSSVIRSLRRKQNFENSEISQDGLDRIIQKLSPVNWFINAFC